MKIEERLASEGGMVNCGDWLGVYVGTDIKATPKAWVFIPLEEATPEGVREAIDYIKGDGKRSNWPPAEKLPKPQKIQNRKKKRSFMRG